MASSVVHLLGDKPLLARHQWRDGARSAILRLVKARAPGRSPLSRHGAGADAASLRDTLAAEQQLIPSSHLSSGTFDLPPPSPAPRVNSNSDAIAGWHNFTQGWRQLRARFAPRSRFPWSLLPNHRPKVDADRPKGQGL